MVPPLTPYPAVLAATLVALLVQVLRNTTPYDVLLRTHYVVIKVLSSYYVISTTYTCTFTYTYTYAYAYTCAYTYA